MNKLPLFGLSVLMSFVAFGVVTRTYIWPRLRMARREEALIALTVPHTFRFIGLSFLIPGVVSSSLPSAFAAPAAYGDLFAAILAVLAIWSLSARAWFATVFNVWGAADLLVAFYQGLLGVRIDPASLGAGYFIPTVVVPPLLVTHGLMFWLLLRKPSSTRHQASAALKLGRQSIIADNADPNHPALPSSCLPRAPAVLRGDSGAPDREMVADTTPEARWPDCSGPGANNTFARRGRPLLHSESFERRT